MITTGHKRCSPAERCTRIIILISLQIQEVMGSHGGVREGSGRKPKFETPADKVIRVPSSIADRVLAVAQILDRYEGLEMDSGSLRAAVMREIEARLFR